MWYL
ncbi:hypothetical protein LEMLEM_LOCUS26016 [Lemmus lemmus]|jgi:hypothetical protein